MCNIMFWLMNTETPSRYSSGDNLWKCEKIWCQKFFNHQILHMVLAVVEIWAIKDDFQEQGSKSEVIKSLNLLYMQSSDSNTHYTNSVFYQMKPGW